MRQGTTPTHTFTLPFGADKITALRVIYAQENKTILTKTQEAASLSGNKVVVKLTQEETFKFSPETDLQVQLRVLTDEGDAPASRIFREVVYPSLSDEVLEGAKNVLGKAILGKVKLA